MTTRNVLSITCLMLIAIGTSSADPLPPDATYRPLPTAPLDAVRKRHAVLRM